MTEPAALAVPVSPIDAATKPEIPEYAASWHAFITWAVARGHVPPSRMVERVIAEIAAAEVA